MRAFLGEKHSDGPDIRAAVEAIENNPGHFIPYVLDSPGRGFNAALASGLPKLNWRSPLDPLPAPQFERDTDFVGLAFAKQIERNIPGATTLEASAAIGFVRPFVSSDKCSWCSNQYSLMRNN
jgi:hypothetical protein